MRTSVSPKPYGHRRGTLPRLSLAVLGALIMTVLVLLAMIELLDGDRTPPGEDLRYYPDLGRLTQSSDDVASTRSSAPGAAHPPPQPTPGAGAVATVVWERPAKRSSAFTLPDLPRRELTAIEAPRPSVRPQWADRPIDWHAQARAAAAAALEAGRDPTLESFSASSREGRGRGPAIDFDPDRLAPAQRLPESYINAYGEGEIRISEDCVGRENRSMADLDYIDALPLIINCRRPGRTFELPPEILDRRRRLTIDESNAVISRPRP